MIKRAVDEGLITTGGRTEVERDLFESVFHTAATATSSGVVFLEHGPGKAAFTGRRTVVAVTRPRHHPISIGLINRQMPGNCPHRYAVRAGLTTTCYPPSNRRSPSNAGDGFLGVR